MNLWPFKRSESRTLRLTPDAEATVRGAGFGMDAGASTSIGRTVSTERALGTSAVYSCVTLLAKLVGGMPLGTWKRGPESSVLPVSGTPLANLLRYEPMPGVTAKAFWFTVVAHLLLRGNAFLMKVKVEDAAGRTRVSELRIIHPDRVDVRIDENGQKVFRVHGSRGHKDFTRDDVIHIVGMSFGTGLVGHSVISIMRHRLSAHVAASDHQDELLSNGLTAKAKLKIPGIYDDPADDEQRNLIRASLRKFYGGARNAGNNVIFLDRDWDLDAISINPHDAQFLEQYRFTFTEVAGWFNIPPGAIGGADGGGKGLFYTSAAMNDLDLLKKGRRSAGMLSSAGSAAGTRTTRSTMPDVTPMPCSAEHCFVPHEDFTTFIDDGWAGKVYSPTPRPAAEGHEALMIHYGPETVTVNTEFGEHRSAVEIPVATFDRLVDQVRNGGWSRA